MKDKEIIKKQDELIEELLTTITSIDGFFSASHLTKIGKMNDELAQLKAEAEKEVSDKVPLKEKEYLLFLEYIEDKMGEVSTIQDRIKIVRQYRDGLIPASGKVTEKECTCVHEYNDDHHPLLVWQCPVCAKAEESGKPQIEQGKEKCKRKQDNSDSICPDCGKDHYEGRNV